MSTSVQDNHFQLLLNRIQNFSTDRERYRQGFGNYDTVSENPLTFYDRHIDPNLSLARVEIIPSMIQLFSDICDEEFRALLAVGPTSYQQDDLPGANKALQSSRSGDIANVYPHNLGNFCCYFPSKLYFDPKRRDLFTVFDFNFRRTSGYRPTFMTEAFLSMHSEYLRPPRYDQDRDVFLPPYDGLEDYRGTDFERPDLAEINASSPQLAIWDFYPMNLAGEKLIKTMSDIPRFEWVTSYTKGQQIGTADVFKSPPPTDEQGFFLRLVRNSTKKAGNTLRPKETRARKGSKIKTSNKNGGVGPSPAWRTSRPYRVDTAHFLQHAWARAVANDATFLILTCGRYERIGFRHRASRTLYLSGLIDTVSCQNPAYGKLHVGLYFAIAQDAIHRQQLRLNSSSTSGPAKSPVNLKKPSSKKRHLSEIVPKTDKAGRSKRQRIEPQTETRSEEAESNVLYNQTISEALSTRNLALMNLNYAVYRSSFPSSFIRKGPSCASGFYKDPKSFKEPNRRATYLPHQYFSVELGKSVDKGATGTIHRAVAEIVTESGQVLKYPLIIKLVFLDRDIRPLEERETVKTAEDRLLNEYSVYQRLAAAGAVGGILPVYGLFEDLETGTLALIMEDGGTSLKRRQLAATGATATITEISQVERDILVRGMKGVHKAGVRHRDIRTENIVVNSKNGAFIIDFDRAEFTSSPSEALDRELQLMQHIVDGIVDPMLDYYSF